MRFDASIHPSSLREIPETSRRAEDCGFDALWTSETQHNPFLPLALAAEHSENLQLGTSVAIGFTRSPTELAHTAWDLSQQSGGRFILGLGTQVKAHIERRFGMDWPDSPVGKLRELIAGIRAVWGRWQQGEELNLRGEYYTLTLMSPFFNPGSIKHPEIPIHIAGVNPGLCRLAGEIADGFHVHPLHTARYLRESVIPAIREGADRAQRSLSDAPLTISAFVVNDEKEERFVRSQIAFYASTPSYRRVMALHGWGDVAEQLSTMARRRAWDSMPAVITDEMLRQFAVVAPEEDTSEALKEKYSGLAHRIKLYRPFVPGERDEFWRRLCAEI